MTSERHERVAAVAEDLIESAKEVPFRHDFTHRAVAAEYSWQLRRAE